MTNQTFRGADIVATFHDRVIGRMSSISYTVSRERAPIYTMGRATPYLSSRERVKLREKIEADRPKYRKIEKVVSDYVLKPNNLLSLSALQEEGEDFD